MSKTDSGVLNGNTVKKALAEILGVLLMVLMGCMGCVPGWSHGSPNQFHRSFGFGMIVMCIIQTIGHVSGAHINPSVTLAALISRTISIPLAIVYILSHFIGGIIGYGLFLFITPNYAYNNETGFCGTSIAPDVTATQAVCVEMFITAVLIFVTCSVWDPWNAHQTETVPIKFAITFTVLAHTAGGYTGASMNPARSFGPALWNNEWKDHWVYWVGPLLGSTLAALFYQTVFYRGISKIQSEDILLEDSSGRQRLEKA